MGLRHLRQRQVCVGCDPTAAELGRRPPRNANTEPMHILTYLRSSAYEQSPPLAESARPPAHRLGYARNRPAGHRSAESYVAIVTCLLNRSFRHGKWSVNEGGGSRPKGFGSPLLFA